MDRETALSKIRKCLALASSSNANEAAAAMRQAQKLMAMFDVSEGEAQASPIGDLVVESKSTPMWLRHLSAAVAESLGLRVILKSGSGFHFFGEENRIALAEYALQVLRKACVKATKEYGKEAREALETAHPDYFGGFYVGRRWYRSQRAFLSASSREFALGWALTIRGAVDALHVDQSTQDAIEERVGRCYPILDKAKRTRLLDSGAARAGQAAGSAFSMKRPMNGAGFGGLLTR